MYATIGVPSNVIEGDSHPDNPNYYEVGLIKLSYQEMVQRFREASETNKTKPYYFCPIVMGSGDTQDKVIAMLNEGLFKFPMKRSDATSLIKGEILAIASETTLDTSITFPRKSTLDQARDINQFYVRFVTLMKSVLDGEEVSPKQLAALIITDDSVEKAAIELSNLRALMSKLSSKHPDNVNSVEFINKVKEVEAIQSSLNGKFSIFNDKLTKLESLYSKASDLKEQIDNLKADSYGRNQQLLNQLRDLQSVIDKQSKKLEQEVDEAKQYRDTFTGKLETIKAENKAAIKKIVDRADKATKDLILNLLNKVSL